MPERRGGGSGGTGGSNSERLSRFEENLIRSYEQDTGQVLGLKSRVALLEFLDKAAESVNAGEGTTRQRMLLRQSRYREHAQEAVRGMGPAQLRAFGEEVVRRRQDASALERLASFDGDAADLVQQTGQRNTNRTERAPSSVSNTRMRDVFSNFDDTLYGLVNPDEGQPARALTGGYIERTMPDEIIGEAHDPRARSPQDESRLRPERAREARTASFEAKLETPEMRRYLVENYDRPWSDLSPGQRRDVYNDPGFQRALRTVSGRESMPLTRDAMEMEMIREDTRRAPGSAPMEARPGSAEYVARANRLRGRTQGEDLGVAEDMLGRMVSREDTPEGAIGDLRRGIQRHVRGMEESVDADLLREFNSTVSGQEAFRTKDTASVPVDYRPLPDEPEQAQFQRLVQNLDPEAGAERFTGYLGSRRPSDPAAMPVENEAWRLFERQTDQGARYRYAAEEMQPDVRGAQWDMLDAETNPWTPGGDAERFDMEGRGPGVRAAPPAGTVELPSEPGIPPRTVSPPGVARAARGPGGAWPGTSIADFLKRSIGPGLNALGLAGNVMDLGSHRDFMQYMMDQNAQGGVETSSGARVPVDTGMAGMYSGLGSAIPFLGSFMFDRNKFMSDPAYRDRYLYGDNPAVAS